MPYFNFDLVIGEVFKDQGGMILEDSEIAIDKANSLASELRIIRPDLRSRGMRCARYRRRQSRILPYSRRPCIGVAANAVASRSRTDACPLRE
jgi:hypothetical protein